MSPKTDRQMRIKNVSSQNLATARPTSLLLRRKPRSPNDKLAYRSQATMAESQIPESIWAWEKQKMVTIIPVKGDQPLPAEPKGAKRPEPREAKPKTVAKQNDKAEEKGAFDKAVTTSSLAADKEAVEAEEEGPPAKDRVDLSALEPVRDKPSVGSVASAADGSPAVTLPTPPAEAPPAPEADKIYTIEELNDMKAADVREIVKARTLGVRSTQKTKLIGAILAAQSKESEKETTEE